MPCQIKICGLSDEASLQAAIDAGASYVGLVHFAKSPRHISLERAATLRKLLPPSVMSVMVVVDPNDDLLNDIITNIRPDYIQLHGHETPAYIADIRSKYPSQKLIKALAISSKQDLAETANYAPHIDIFLFDAKASKDATLPGGNGIAFDWKILNGFTGEKPWMLSGGLNASNVQQAIHQTGAPIVDVSSGVESAPGKKEATKIKEFIVTGAVIQNLAQ